MKKLFSFLASSAFLMAALPLFAQDGASEAAPSSGGSMIQTVIMIAVALVFFYFILWRPEQKRRKQMQQVRSSLKKGDRVTAMGIIGTVVKVQDNSVIVSLYDGAKMEILKAAITDVQPSTEEKVEKSIEASETR
jgi:preprotein translocase subunit YajC